MTPYSGADRRIDPCPATPASTIRSWCCRRPSATRSSPCGTSAAPWTMRWTRSTWPARASPADERRPPPRSRAGAASWPPASTAARPQTRQGRALAPLVTTFGLTRAPFEALIEGVEMDLGPRRYETFDDLYEYLHSRRVGGRAHLPRDLRQPRSGVAAVRDRSRRGPAAHEHPARRAGRSRAGPRLHSAGGSSRPRLHAKTICAQESAHGRRRRAVARGEGAAAAAGAARPRLLRARGARLAAARRAPARGRGDHGGHLSRRARRHRTARLRRLLGGRAHPAAAPRRHRRLDVASDPARAGPGRPRAPSSGRR